MAKSLKLASKPIKSIAQAKKALSSGAKKFARVKCNCGHYPKDHYNNEGWRHHSEHKNAGQCGCTWHYPNDKYILRQRKKDLEIFISAWETFSTNIPPVFDKAVSYMLESIIISCRSELNSLE